MGKRQKQGTHVITVNAYNMHARDIHLVFLWKLVVDVSQFLGTISILAEPTPSCKGVYRGMCCTLSLTKIKVTGFEKMDHMSLDLTKSIYQHYNDP